ncbi:hypothetical protein MTR67_012050 [Solanum verrucosum]|uniref:Uncharacterized protein n=1 Tax=Solanum verrucosum TaxID=315347 RepID=A0AAF0QAM2_SOLVR|nr:hypothetical protein MTR67_012050 [Solanum verrucosum]
MHKYKRGYLYLATHSPSGQQLVLEEINCSQGTNASMVQSRQVSTHKRWEVLYYK